MKKEREVNCNGTTFVITVVIFIITAVVNEDSCTHFLYNCFMRLFIHSSLEASILGFKLMQNYDWRD